MRSVGLFAAAAVAEIGGVFLIWRASREGTSIWEGAVGAVLLTGYGFLATLQRDPHFGRVLAAYGGVFVVGSLLWAAALDGFRPHVHDLVGAGVCLVGTATIMWG